MTEKAGSKKQGNWVQVLTPTTISEVLWLIKTSVRSSVSSKMILNLSKFRCPSAGMWNARRIASMGRRMVIFAILIL
jgi:hypothetical protein